MRMKTWKGGRVNRWKDGNKRIKEEEEDDERKKEEVGKRKREERKDG